MEKEYKNKKICKIKKYFFARKVPEDAAVTTEIQSLGRVKWMLWAMM